MDPQPSTPRTALEAELALERDPVLRSDVEQVRAERDRFTERAASTGMDSAARNDPDWLSSALAFIESLPSGVTFTADLVRANCGPSSAMGSAISAASRRRLIRAAGVTTSTSMTRHGGLLRVWERT
jgi:hypothetical protein